jgi:hypothetical protein
MTYLPVVLGNRMFHVLDRDSDCQTGIVGTINPDPRTTLCRLSLSSVVLAKVYSD